MCVEGRTQYLPRGGARILIRLAFSQVHLLDSKAFFNWILSALPDGS